MTAVGDAFRRESERQYAAVESLKSKIGEWPEQQQEMFTILIARLDAVLLDSLASVVDYLATRDTAASNAASDRLRKDVAKRCDAIRIALAKGDTETMDELIKGLFPTLAEHLANTTGGATTDGNAS